MALEGVQESPHRRSSPGAQGVISGLRGSTPSDVGRRDRKVGPWARRPIDSVLSRPTRSLTLSYLLGFLQSDSICSKSSIAKEDVSTKSIPTCSWEIRGLEGKEMAPAISGTP